ncbi:ATP-binding response regulator [Polaribacter aquimarinus]|uniref:histidine kinase n=1 Tax=Polaribacter aquimarinus TaxID=2100726 RepID=A0A2U2J9W7_9FLAO|nr:ATP-binding protein [Polaribacter aquimarinus]PWG05112.1 hypothetical protein DIS07_07645 [Polaribacter aquimarinus]
MIPAKIEDVFLQITTDFSGVIQSIDAGKFIKNEFILKDTVYNTCPFLEGTLDALEIKEPFLLEGMVVFSDNQEFNVDLEVFKNNNSIKILIHNRTNVYKIVDQLNQNRNDIFFVKREIAEKNKELDRLRKIADKANEEKSRFLAMMSHEIRNPLNAILGYTELISLEQLNDNVIKHIKNLTAAGKNLKVIVDDILDLSRIEAGKLELVSEQISLEEIIINCKNDFKHQQQNKDVKLIFEVDKNIPNKLLGDSVRIHQILSNLISNAIKFTKKGKIKTIAKIISEKSKSINIQFGITDTGRGMSEKQLTKIFEEYQQNKIADQRIKGGAGLGLAIVNRLVSAMNGKIFVESELNVGTTFFVEIPLKKYLKHTIKKANISLNDSIINLKGKKILVADDDLLNQTIVHHFLTNASAEITIVKDGLEALSKIESTTFDVILLDINMPNMTGEELIQKASIFKEFNPKTPVLALTANATKEDIDGYIKIGFFDVISKPFTSEVFLNKIYSVI